MRRLLWYLAIFVLLIGIVCTKKNDNTANQDESHAASTGDINGNEFTSDNQPEDSATRKLKGQRGHKRITVIDNNGQLTTLELASDKSSTQLESVSQEHPVQSADTAELSSVASENNEHNQRKNKTKTKQKDILSDQQQPALSENTETTSDGGLISTEAIHVKPQIIARDRSVGIPDRFESEFPQNPQAHSDGAAAAARTSQRRGKATPIPNELFPVEKHDESVVLVHAITPSSKKRKTTTKAADDDADYKPEDFHILTGIPPEDLDFRNPSTKATVPTSTTTTTITTSTSTTTTTTTAATITSAIKSKKLKTTTETVDDEESTAGFHILTGIPEDFPPQEPVAKRGHTKKPTLPIKVEQETAADFHILTGIPNDDEVDVTTESKPATRKPNRKTEEKQEIPADFHILTGIPEDFKEETTVPPKLLSTKKFNKRPTTPSGDEEDEEETQKFYILTGIPQDFAGAGHKNVEDEIHTEPLSITKKVISHKIETAESLTTVPTTSTSTTTTTTTTTPTTSTTTEVPTVHTTKTKKTHKQRTRERLENSKLVATDAEFGKAVNSQFNAIVRNLSAAGVLTEKDLLSERILKNISDIFAEHIQQSLLARDSSEPLSPLERELILEENSEKVIAEFKASRPTKPRMEKRHGSVVDLETLEPSTEGVRARLESSHLELGEIETTQTTLSSALSKDSKHRNRTRVNLSPVQTVDSQHQLKDGQIGKNGTSVNLDIEVTESSIAGVSNSIHSKATDADSSAEDASSSVILETTLSGKHTGSSSKNKLSPVAESQLKETTNKDHSLAQFETSTISDHTGPLILTHVDGNSEITVITHKLQNQQYETSTNVEPSAKSKSKGSTHVSLVTDVTEESEFADSSETSTSNPLRQLGHEFGSTTPELFPKKHQTPLVHFQVGAIGASLPPSGIEVQTELGLTNNTNEPEESDSTNSEEQSTAVSEEDVKTHFVTRGPLKIPFKGRAEPTELNSERSNETSTLTSTGFPDPPNWSNKENESFFAGYRTKPVPVEIENGENNERNVSESSQEAHEMSPHSVLNTHEVSSHTLLNATTSANTAAGLLFLLSENKSLSETTTLSSISRSTNEFEDEFDDVTASSTHRPNASSTANFGITYQIDIIETTSNVTSLTGNTTASSLRFNETSTRPLETSSENSLLSLIAGSGSSNSTHSSLSNTSLEQFETSSQMSHELFTAKETTLGNTTKEATIGNIILNTTAVLSGSNLSAESTSSESSAWTHSESTSNSTQSILLAGGISEISNSPHSENTSTVPSVTRLSSEVFGEPALVTINVNKSNAVPEPEWSKSTEFPSNITSEKTPGVPEPEWSKSTIKNIDTATDNISGSFSEVTKAVESGIAITGQSGSVSTSDLTSAPRPANVAVVTWTFKFLDLEWESELNDKVSWQYKQLAGKVEPELTKAFKDILKEKFVGLSIKRFSSGSVVVNGQTEITEKVDTAQLEDSFRTYLRGQKFTIAGDLVDSGSIRVEGFGDTASQTGTGETKVVSSGASGSGGGVPGYVIGIIVAVIILVLVVVAIGLYLRRYRNRHSRDENYMTDQENGSAGAKTWQSPPQPQQRAPSNGRDQYAGVNMYEMKGVPAHGDPHGQVNQGYQSDGRTNGFSGSARNSYPHPSSNL